MKSCMAQGFNVGKFHPGQVLFAFPWAQAASNAFAVQQVADQLQNAKF